MENVVIVGKIIEAHCENDEFKFKSYVDLLIKKLEESNNTRAVNIIKSKINGSYKKQNKVILDSIENCYMTKKFEHPGIEEGKCAGLRNSDEEPCEQCKSCILQYQYEE